MKKFFFYLLFFISLALLYYLPALINPSLLLNRGNDLEEFFSPIINFTKQQFILNRSLPLWNNSFFAGMPLISDPQNPSFYPLNIVFLLFSLKLGFIISFITHSIIGAFGFFLLCKLILGLDDKISLISGAFYLINPKFSGFLEAGHFGIVISLAWLPYVFIALLKMLKNKNFFWSIFYSISLTFIFLTHTVTFFLTIAGSLFVLIASLFTERSKRLQKILFFCMSGLMTFGLSAIALLPQIEWMPLTTRNILLLNPDIYPKWESLTEITKNFFLLPFYNHKYIWSIDSEKWIASGLVLTILSIWGILKIKKIYRRFLIIILGLILIVGLNNASPFSEYLITQNWYKLMRIATRPFIFINLGILILASIELQHLYKKSKLIVYIISLFVILESLSISWIRLAKPVEKPNRISSKVYSFLANDPDKFRVFCVTRCISPLDAVNNKLELIEGYNTLQQTNYYKESWQLTGQYWNYYTLSIPPFGVYLFDRLNPDPISLGEFNTKYIISPYKLSDQRFLFKKSIDNYYIYENSLFLPRAYFIDNQNKPLGEAKIIEYFPNKIAIETKSKLSNKVVLSEVYSPGWHAFLDEKNKTTILEKPNTLRQIEISPQTNFITLKYFPKTLKLGMVITGVTIFLILSFFGIKMIKVINFRNFILTTYGIFFGLFLLELSLQIFFYLSDRQIFGLKPVRTSLVWKEDPILGKKLAPNQTGWFVGNTNEYFTKIDINSEGWRDIEHKKVTDKNIYRILILGDSFVENFQVPLEKTFFRQLENNLNKSLSGKKFEIIAMGIGNTGTAQQFITLEKFGLIYKPNLVIQMFLTANDFKNNSYTLQSNPYMPYFSINGDGNLKLIPPREANTETSSKIKKLLKKTSLISFMLSARQKRFEMKSNKTWGYPIDYHIYDLIYPDELEKAYMLTEKLLLQTRKLAKQNGADYLLVILANNEQINNNLWKEILIEYPKIKNTSVDLGKPDKLLYSFCKTRQIDCLFMYPYFKNFTENNPGLLTHYKKDGHWNEIGTNLAAEFLYENLKGYLKIK